MDLKCTLKGVIAMAVAGVLFWLSFWLMCRLFCIHDQGMC